MVRSKRPRSSGSPAVLLQTLPPVVAPASVTEDQADGEKFRFALWISAGAVVGVGWMTPAGCDTTQVSLHNSRILALVRDGLRGGPHPRPRQRAPTMTERFTSLTRQEREALIDTKETRFLEHLARKLEVLGPDPDSGTPSCFHRRRGRTAIPVVREGTHIKTAGM
jgi:hypothetical protein